MTFYKVIKIRINRKEECVMSIKHMIPWAGRKKNVPVRIGEGDRSPLFSLHREMNHLFDEFNHALALPSLGSLEERLETFSPRLNVSENEKEVRIAVELPGMDENDIDVSLSEGYLTIRGEKRDEREDKKGNYYRMERSYGSFQRTIPLPLEVDEGKTDASFKKGVLNITIPKVEEAQRKVKKIPIQAG